MKKLIFILVISFVLIIMMGIGAIINLFDGTAVAVSDTLADNTEDLCNYTTANIIFNDETEKKREIFEKKLDEYYVNAALALYQYEKTMDPQTIIDEIETWDISYGIQANIQDFKYHHQYIPYLKSIDEEHSLSTSRRFFEDHYENKDSEDYRYYLDILSLVNKECMIQVDGEYTTPLKFPFIITQDFNVPHVFGKVHFGIDLVKDYGASVYAPASGKVDKIGKNCPPNGGYLGNMCNLGQGNFVQIKVKDGQKTIYVETMHMKDVIVDEGDEVLVGQLIGSQGNSGNSTGSHVHVEFRKIRDISTNLNDFLNPHTFVNFFQSKGENEGDEKQ